MDLSIPVLKLLNSFTIGSNMDLDFYFWTGVDHFKIQGIRWIIYIQINSVIIILIMKYVGNLDANLSIYLHYIS
jgi:hypothetical protein